MRRIIALLLCLSFAFSLSGCTLIEKNVGWETIEVEANTSLESENSEDSSEFEGDDASEPSFDNVILGPILNGEETTYNPQSQSGSSNMTSDISSSYNENSLSQENVNLSDTSNNEDSKDSQIIAFDKADKPNVEEPGALSSTVPDSYDSLYNSDAKNMRRKVLFAKDNLRTKGTTYYISAKGSDDNNGTSKETPWATIIKLNEMKNKLKPGDVVLFERGYVYRTIVAVKLVSGVSYGAYGTGDKPCIYGSGNNYAKSNWVNIGENLWRLSNVTIKGNVGIIVFNHGEEVGYRYDSQSKLSKNFDFYSSSGYVVLYLDRDPAKAFDSIEIGQDGRLFDMPTGSKNITIENICFKYTGGHAVRGSNCSNITVRGLEIGYVGGSILTGYGTGNVRYGNGIEFMNESRNILVENNWIYQIYDSGVTHQGSGKYHLDGFIVRNNLIEYCGMGSIEYWHTEENDIANVLYEGNLLRFAGYGFGGAQRPDKEMTGHIMSNAKPTGGLHNKATNFIIKNNLFELSTYQIVNATSSAGTPPTLIGNTYVQWDEKWLGYYNKINNIKFSADVEDIIKNDWADSNAIVELINN